jgi:formate/nitrite transporter FocA (FNT family)
MGLPEKGAGEMTKMTIAEARKQIGAVWPKAIVAAMCCIMGGLTGFMFGAALEKHKAPFAVLVVVGLFWFGFTILGLVAIFRKRP